MWANFKKKYLKKSVLILLVIAALYGSGRIYFRVTDGFTISNITSDFSPDARWETRLLSSDEKSKIDSILSQKFTYLGKGCQSYVFQSEDGQYVLKFFKYQRFRIQPWLNYLNFIPFVETYRQAKIEKKKAKLEGVFRSWKLAFEELQPETGFVYVHLNKSHDIEKPLTIYDKMGVMHQVDLNQLEFLVQRKATMLCPYITELMKNSKELEAKRLLNRILILVLTEYDRGLADNDHALMQNTGVLDERPVHIDVGQFVRNTNIHRPEVYTQELFTKTYKFRIWLRKRYPSLADYLEEQLVTVIGEQFWTMKPVFKPHNV